MTIHTEIHAPSDVDRIEAALEALDALGRLGRDEFQSICREIEQAVEAGEYAVEIERYPAEPYSWGQSRGYEIEATATLESWSCHGFTGNRADAIRLIGKQFVEGCERTRAEAAAEAAE